MRQPFPRLPFRRRSGGSTALLGSTLGLLAISSAALQAQTSTETKPDETIIMSEMVVTGVRASLMTAQEIKQNAPLFVDSIVAEDIGKFPDTTVAEALQRVPGIQVGRAAGEVSSVVIRGLPNIATTLNGHEIFTGTSRGVALQDLPASLIAGLDVYKSQAPDQTEGGIAGLIDVRLRRPLDFKGLAGVVGLRGIYADNADKYSWAGDVLVSNRWKLDGGGEFGALFATARQNDRVQDTIRFNFLFEPTPTGVTANPVPLPLTAGAQVNPNDRTRTAHNLSLQWKPNANLEIYSDTLYTGYRNTHDVHFFIGFPRFGAFQNVTLIPGSDAPRSVTSTNNFHLTSTQAFRDKTDSYQTVLGAKWRDGDLKATTEYVYNWSTVKHRAVIVDTQFVAPATFKFDFTPEDSVNVAINGADVSAANNYRLWGLFDNHDYATSRQHEWKADVEKSLTGFLSSIKGGVRVTDRSARSRATAQNDIPPADGRGVKDTSTIPGFGSPTPDAKFDITASNWYGGDPDFLRDHVDTIRTLFGQPTTDPNFFPGNSFTDKERTYAGYLQANYSTRLGDLPFDGLFGVRVVNTKEKLEGNKPDNTPVNADKSETQVLPSLTGRLKLQDNLQLRASVGRAITRPNFSDYNPVTALFGATTTGGSFGTGSGGNPELGSVKSNNYDLSLEYYFGKASYVAVTPFYRTINGYVQTFASTERIGGQDYIVTRPRNGGKGHLDGVELSYQQFFDFLPEAFRGFGVQTNFTYIEGSQDVADTSPNAPVGARVNQPYTQVSKYNYNIVGIFERGPVSVRLAWTWRGRFVDTFNGPNAPGSALRTISVRPRGQLDLSASYDIAKGLSVTFDVINALGDKYHDYFGSDEALYPRDARVYDTIYQAGVRYRF